MNAPSGRRRAWVLLRFEDPGAAAIQISGTFQEGGDEWVVVRADVVIDGEYNLVVPVDAADEAWLQVVLGNLAKVPGLIKVKVLRVESYNPSPSHRAHSYVTASEVDEFRVPEFAEPGRHPKSPGANPWG